MKKITFLFLSMLMTFVATAQSIDPDMSTENMIYMDGIRSVKVKTEEAGLLQIPIITLNSSEKFILEFDDLTSESRYFKYTLIHCTHDWKFSDLNQLEYLEGFGEDDLNDSYTSFNTIQEYVKYRLVFPTDNLKPLVSGNYLLFVYESDPSTPVLTRRIMLEEPVQMSVQATISAAQDVEYRDTKQEVDLIVGTGAYPVRNPAMNMHVSIIQNGRWDNAIVGLTHYSSSPGELRYNYGPLNKTVFDGNGEFRVFDTQSLKFLSTGIASSTYKADTNIVYILEDIARPYAPYAPSFINAYGQCGWNNKDTHGEYTEDYVMTKFSLRCDFSVTGGDLYLFGELTDWRILPEAKLKYNSETNYWEAGMYLKQGIYNYHYVYVPKNSDQIDATYIEGSHWQTRNTYTVLVYMREEGSSIDRLAGSYVESVK